MSIVQVIKEGVSRGKTSLIVYACLIKRRKLFIGDTSERLN